MAHVLFFFGLVLFSCSLFFLDELAAMTGALVGFWAAAVGYGDL